MPSLACLPSFPCLDAWLPFPTDQKCFHLGTEGEHHAFLGLLALLPFLGSLTLKTNTFSFKYRPTTNQHYNINTPKHSNPF